ncbi:MAG: hypothetical protein PUE90_10675 [Bacteroidales bacterium]|nr:hypothetical protein [Bacteroidales bacterium]
MKRVLKFLCICTVVVLSLSTPVMGMPQTNNQQATSANWIEVGTVIGDCYDHNGVTWYLTGPKELKLYVLYLGEKLIYRVEWNGKSYPVVHNNNSSSYNASARIPGWVYMYKTDGDYTSGKKTYDDETYVSFDVPTW